MSCLYYSAILAVYIILNKRNKDHQSFVLLCATVSFQLCNKHLPCIFSGGGGHGSIPNDLSLLINRLVGFWFGRIILSIEDASDLE